MDEQQHNLIRNINSNKADADATANAIGCFCTTSTSTALSKFFKKRTVEATKSSLQYNNERDLNDNKEKHGKNEKFV